MSSSAPPHAITPKKRILFLFSDTGGGHRSATTAMIEAMHLEFPGVFETEMVDFFKQYYPRPLSYAPDVYPPITRFPEAWGLSYHAFDGKYRTRWVNRVVYPYVKRAATQLIKENPADLIVSVHPLVNNVLLRAMKKAPRPFITVVTDMVSTHAFWFDKWADLIIVPTEHARERGIRYGVSGGNIRVAGLPVADKFCHPPEDKGALRERLGWRKDLPVILLVGGGDGMGPLSRVARAINKAGLESTLVVVCGRNEALRHRVESIDWRMPVHVYGFVDQMPDFMAAADIFATKAGPGSISEAFILGLPLVLYARMPGQEDGNVTYVLEEGAGVWAPRTDLLVAALRRWIVDPEAREAAAQASRRVARPQAARQIARMLAGNLGVR